MADVELIALTVEARRRGMTYGKLVGATTREERKKIVDKFRRSAKKEKAGR